MAKAKTLISRAVTAQLICSFVFAYAKDRFCHDAACIFGLCDMILNQRASAKLKFHHRKALIVEF